MLKYNLISPNLIVSRTAYRVYRVSAGVSILLFVGLCVTLSERNIPEIIILSFAQPLLFVFAVSTAITLVGMEVYLFRFDNSSPLKQVFWFIAMLVPLLGAAIYCFVVYSRSDVFKTGDEQAHVASAR